MKHCSKCKKDFSRSDNFCDYCGNKLKIKKAKEETQQEHLTFGTDIDILSKKKNIYIAFAIIVVLLLGIVLGLQLRGNIFEDKQSEPIKATTTCSAAGGVCAFEDNSCPKGTKMSLKYTCDHYFYCCMKDNNYIPKYTSSSPGETIE